MNAAQLTDLALTVANELSEAPPYIVMAPANYPRLPGCDAFAQVTPSPAIRQHLIGSDQWRGPAPAIVFHATTNDTQSLMGIVLHEVAHLLPFVPPSEVEATPTTVEAELCLMQRLVKLAPDDSLLPPWGFWHAADFNRRVLHLQARAALKGYEIPLPALCFAGQRYAQSGAWKYRNALGDEPARMLNHTFAEIEAQLAPDEFTKLFDGDAAYWRKHNPPTKGKAA